MTVRLISMQEPWIVKPDKLNFFDGFSHMFIFIRLTQLCRAKWIQLRSSQDWE